MSKSSDLTESVGSVNNNYQPKVLADAPLNDVPPMLDNLVDNPYQKRAQGNIDTTFSLATILFKRVQIAVDTDAATGFGVKFVHNLGFTPYVMGAYRILDGAEPSSPSTEFDIRNGQIRQIPSYSAYIDTIPATKDKEIYIQLLGGTKAEVVLYFFKERGI